MISIIVPSFNRAHFLPRAISSILNQTYEDWELIISDDGSTDNTESVILPYLADHRIHYIRNKNRGATAARNSGVQVAKGEYITFLDSDDEAKPEWLKCFKEKIDMGAKVVCCGYDYINHEGNLICTNLPKNMGQLFGNRIGRFTNGGVFLLPKNLFLEIGGYDENVRSGQHSELAIRLFQSLDEKEIEITNLFIPLIKVHVHQGAKIRNDDRAIYEGTVYTLNKHSKIFRKNISLHIDYLKVGAVSAFRIGEISQAQELFFKAWTLAPYRPKTFFQLMVSLIPYLGDKIWKKN